jgi:hypothetical protein
MYQVKQHTYPERPDEGAHPTGPTLTRPPDPLRSPSGLSPRRWDACASEWAARWTGDPREAPAPRRAPEVTREWPATDRPPTRPARPWPLVLMAGLLALVLMGLTPGRFLGTPAGLAVAGSLAALCAVAYVRAVAGETPDHRIVSKALNDLQLDRDPRVIIMRLREAGLRGRAGLRRDVAVRCLEQSELNHVQERSDVQSIIPGYDGTRPPQIISPRAVCKKSRNLPSSTPISMAKGGIHAEFIACSRDERHVVANP